MSVRNLSDWQLTRGFMPLGGGNPNFWLSAPTLRFLHSAPPGLESEAVLLRHISSGREVILTAQTFCFRAGQQVSAAAGGETSRWDFRRRLIARFPIKTLVLGQLLTSGDIAQQGLQQLAPEEVAVLLPAAAETLLQGRQGYLAVLLKDLFAEADPATGRLMDRGFAHLPADPVMKLDLRPWPSFGAYVEDLSSKYRVRYRRARSYGEGIGHRRLGREDASLVPQLFSLYAETSSGASFNVTALTPDYFRWLLEAAEIQGYFNGTGELIGFTTAIPNGQIYHAHYLGLREAYKWSHHLYHNMLFDLLEAGLEGRFATLDFGRTALEIKSSLGAKPHRYANLLRLRSGLLNGLVPRFVRAVFAAQDWQPRSPFRAG